MKIASRSYTKVLLPLPTKVLGSHAISYPHMALLILLRNHQTHPCRIMKIRPSAMKRPVPEPKQTKATNSSKSTNLGCPMHVRRGFIHRTRNSVTRIASLPRAGLGRQEPKYTVRALKAAKAGSHISNGGSCFGRLVCLILPCVPDLALWA